MNANGPEKHVMVNDLDLGKFSVSLAVKDLQASKLFYMKLGFKVIPNLDHLSDQRSAVYDQNWVILENRGVRLGLFQGMFQKNTLTWNPEDVREIQRALKQQGLRFESEVDESSEGRAAAMLFDPDGNPILLDQVSP